MKWLLIFIVLLIFGCAESTTNAPINDCHIVDADSTQMDCGNQTYTIY